ncbi:MAG: hypothetical protein AAF570_03885, partial [Bacteroidota bacterium]
GGPVGFFHKHPEATYGDILLPNGNTLEDANGILRDPAGNIIPPDPMNPLTPHPELYPLTSITRYIDYDRSYPNADGNLLSAKPLFYDDETTEIFLFFTKSYATHFFHNWAAYNGNAASDGRIKIVIKDPREGTSIVNPPYLDYDPDDTVHVNIPQTIEAWQDDPNPLLPHIFQMYENLINANECIPYGGDTIIPPSEYLEVQLKHLKPLKLYTAVVNNLFDLDKNGTLDAVSETVEVHKFTFQTSRYRNFEEQVNSYVLKDPEETVTREALFSISQPLTATEIQAAYDTIVDVPNTLSAGIEGSYQHRFDRIYEGILGMTPLDAAISTEFNVIRNPNDSDKIIAVLVRNPEPFNNPRTPEDVIADTISVLNGGGTPDGNYKTLYSKDYSQILIMHDSLEITGTLSLRFQYKIWDGSDYIVPSTPDYSSDSIGTVEVLNLDIQNA